MSILATNKGDFNKFKLPEAGTTQAVCCAVWDLGIQSTPFANDDGTPKTQHKVVIAWELTEKIDEATSAFNGLPYMLSKTYTLSLNEKSNLRKDLESWRGKMFSDEEIQSGFDLEHLVGVNCLLGVAHVEKNSNTYANITAILPPTKGAEKLKVTRNADDKPPKWVSEMITKALDAVTEAEPEEETILW